MSNAYRWKNKREMKSRKHMIKRGGEWRAVAKSTINSSTKVVDQLLVI